MRTLIPLITALTLAACDSSEVDPFQDSSSTTSPDEVELTDIATEEEQHATLLFMREEEKLARDVYDLLDETWGSPQVFASIRSSEQSHMDALLLEIERLGLADPITDDTRGVFVNPALADLYFDLTEDGAVSVEDALTVGALIEDLDIIDLQTAAAQTDDAALIATYSTLECGSRNHLRAFTGQLDQRDLTYTPQFLSPDAYTSILSTDRESCN